jgi:hypothetical protein
MKTIFLEWVVKLFVPPTLAEHIKSLVQIVANMDLTGAQKKQKVLDELSSLAGDIGDQFKSTAPVLVNLAIEAFVTIVYTKTGVIKV